MGEAPGQVRSLRGEVIGMPELGPEAQIRAGKAGAMAGWCQRKGWARGQEQGHRTCSSSCTMPRLLFSTAWMSGERPLLMSWGREGRSLSLSKGCPGSPQSAAGPLGPASQSG